MGPIQLALTEESIPSSLEERITRIEDRIAIHDLIVKYAIFADERQWESLLAMYTDDVERQLAGTLAESVVGKDKLRELYNDPKLPRRTEKDGKAPSASELEKLGLKHMLSTDIIRLSDDGLSAEALVYYTMVATRGDGADMQRGVHDGILRFGFRKQADAWLICRLAIESNNAANPLFRAEA